MTHYKNGKIIFENLIDTETGRPIEIDLPEGCGQEYVDNLNKIAGDISYWGKYISEVETYGSRPIFTPRLVK